MSYMPEPTRPGRRWSGKADEQRAVYANRRRIHGNYGKRLLEKRGELIERSFAHCYDTGAMRRVFLRGRENVLKRQLIHVGAFNLTLVFRQTLGAGTPRELRNRQQRAILLILYFRIALAMNWAPSAAGLRRLKHPTRKIRPFRDTTAVIGFRRVTPRTASLGSDSGPRN